jgi:hypothetical protein
MSLELSHGSTHPVGPSPASPAAPLGEGAPRTDRLAALPSYVERATSGVARSTPDAAPVAVTPSAATSATGELAGLAGPLANACVAFAGASIVGSIAIWAAKRGRSPNERAHAERFGIFVGLWAPTFLGLAEQLRRVGKAPER